MPIPRSVRLWYGHWRLGLKIKEMKKPGLWDRGIVTGESGQKPDWKKWPSLSDSDMVTGESMMLYFYMEHDCPQ